MAIGSNDNIQFNLTNISDNQILVYDASTGSFKNETSAVSANANVTGLGRNVGSQGVGLYKQNDNQYLEFYKLQSGANTTISLNDNVIFIDAVVGSGTLSLGSGNANTVAVFDANGNVLNGSDNILYDGTTLTFIGANNNVSMSDGLVTSNNLVTTNFSIAGGNVTFPTADGNANQILQTDGAGNLTFVNNTDISGKLDSVTFNAHVAQAMVTTGNNAPALNDTYDLGNSSNKFSEIFSTYFRGTADVAVNSQNLGSVPAANYRLVSDSFTKAEVNALIANVDTANTSGLLSNIRVTNGSTSFVQEDGNVDIRGDGNITITPDTTNKRITIGLDSDSIVTRAFRQVSDGTTNVVADNTTDTLTLAGGTGISVTADANTDTFTISATGSAQANVSNTSIGALLDVASVSGISNGQALLWNAANSQFEYGNVVASGGGNSNVALTDFSVTTATASGNGSLSYDNAGVFTFTPANVQSVTQSLSWNSSNKQLTISGGNTVDLSVLMDNTDAQDLTISGNVISLTGQSGNVDLTSALGNVAGNYGDSNVTSHLSTLDGSIIPDSDEAYDLGSSTNKFRDLYLSGNTITLGTTNISAVGNTVSFGDVSIPATSTGNIVTISELTTANTNMQAYVDALESRVVGGANVSLDSLAEVANALANSNTELSTVAFTGVYSDITSKPTLALSGNTYLTFDSANIDLSSVVGQTGATGPQGPQGNAGTDGVSISSGTISGNSLVLTMSDSSTINVTGNVVGPTGATGAAGSNGTDGTDGVGITSVSLVGGANLVLNYSNSSTQDIGNIKGPTGAQGPAGNVLVTTSNAAPSGASEGQMWYATDDGHTYIYHNSAWVQANPGQDAQTISLSGNVLTISGSNSNVDFTSALNINTDAQDLSLSGNTISLSGQSGNVDLTTLLGSYGGGLSNLVEDTSPQLGGALDVNGQDIVTTSNGDIDLDPNGSGVVVFKGNATKGSGQFKLNCENNSHGITIKGPPHSAGASYTLTLPNNDGDANQVLATDGSGGLSWADQTAGLSNTGVTAGTYGNATKSVQLTIDAQGRITSAANVNISGGGGGGSGTSYEYFKLYYTSAGAIDTTQGSGGYSDASTNIGNVTINNAASNSCEVIVDFGGNYNYPPLAITAYGFSQSTSEYLIKGQSASTNNTTLKLAGSGSPHGTLGSANLTLSLTRSETGSSSGFGQSTHAWIYFTMGS